MRGSKIKPGIANLPVLPVITCPTPPRMTISKYAEWTDQTIPAVTQQVDAGKFIMAKGKYGKQREINMVAEYLKEYMAAIEALKECQ